MEADEDGAALIDGDGGGESIKPDFDGRSKCTAMSAELVGATLADAARVVAPNEGLVGVAAQAPTEIATKAAKLAPTTTDECRIELLLGLGCHRDRPQFGGKGSIHANVVTRAARCRGVQSIGAIARGSDGFGSGREA